MSQKQIRYINTQSGRSMVEMLGTLAIMGVLTIGGIAGYRYAINKSNANTILGAVSQMAVTASTELTTQGSLTLPEWKDASGNLSISGAFGVETARYDDGAFGIIVSDMNDEVCERIKGMDWKVPEDVAINGESDSCDQGEANAIEFVFSNTLGKATSENSDSDPDKQENEDCRRGVCETCTQDPNTGAATYTFAPAGTECEIGGLKGTCNGNTNRCNTSEGTPCNRAGVCPSGEFCYYGAPNTPNKCLKAKPRSITIDGVTYYYNSATELKSWCRPDTGYADCGWGYIPRWSAEDYCATIGKRLLTAAEFVAVSEKLRPSLPKPCGGSYWVQGGNLSMTATSASSIYTGRPDGYWCAAGVVCR